MKYKVYSRNYWNTSLQERFGDEYAIHDLTDSEVIDSIMAFGRAEITVENGIRDLYFQNDYD